MFRTLPLSIIRSLSLCTQQWYVSYRFAGSGRNWVPSWSWSQAVSKPVWHVPLLCLQWKTPDDGQRNCPKHVEFYSKGKFEKLVHLVGFITRIYHDARSPERHIHLISYMDMIMSFFRLFGGACCFYFWITEVKLQVTEVTLFKCQIFSLAF